MDDRSLGRGRISVLVVGLGTWQRLEAAAAAGRHRELISTGVTTGIRLFDTSPMYGDAQRLLAGALDGRRDEAFIADKIWTPSAQEGAAQLAREVRAAEDRAGEAAGYGLTQTLAAPPQLVARWVDAQTAEPYAWAVLTAALDAARLGARVPLAAGFSRAAAPGYCTSQQQAEAPDNWFEQALAYATTKLHGAAASLNPAGAGMGRVAGYTVADYLIQHATRERRSARMPASAWDATLSYIRDPADATRLADSARSRLPYRYALPLYRHAADAGDDAAALRLADQLIRRGDLDEAEQILRNHADDEAAAEPLAGLLVRRGDLEELRARAEAGDEAAADQLAGLLAGRGDLDGLRARADTGDGYAALRLADLLAERGDLEESEQVGRARAAAGDWLAVHRLADLLIKRGDLEELRARAEADDEYAALRLPDLLIRQGRGEEAERLRRFGLNPDGSIAYA